MKRGDELLLLLKEPIKSISSLAPLDHLNQKLPHHRRNRGRLFRRPNPSPSIELLFNRNGNVFHSFTVTQFVIGINIGVARFHSLYLEEKSTLDKGRKQNQGKRLTAKFANHAKEIQCHLTTDHPVRPPTIGVNLTQKKTVFHRRGRRVPQRRIQFSFCLKVEITDFFPN